MSKDRKIFFLFFKGVFVMPFLLGLIIISSSSISIFFIESNYKIQIVKIISTTRSNPSYRSEYLSGIGSNTKDSLRTTVLLDDLVRLKLCNNRDEIGNFLVERDSIIPIWLATGRFRSRVRMGSAETFNYFIKEYLNTLVFSILLCIPFLVMHILQKVIWKK